MADEKDKKEKKDSKESKAAEPKAEKKPAKKAAAKKESKPAANPDKEKKVAEKKPAKKAAAKKDDSGDKPTKKESKKAAPKADKQEAKGKEEKDEKPAPDTGKGRRRAKKADAKAEEKKPAPSRRRRSHDPDELPVVRATAKYVRIAPRKARLVADQVRGLHIEQARALLAFSPRDAARDIQKLIDSAAANAENNHDLIGDEMRITSITVDEGPTLRRYRPRALGRATPINKRTSHIAVALTPVED
jgi:ribosomal protein L22